MTKDREPESDSDAKRDAADDGAEAGFNLAELARASGVTERTIRYYQSEKLIPKPAKQGRDRRYDESHLERLALIADLRDRGLNLNTIRDLVDNDDPTRTVASWLGIDAAFRAPWSQDRPRTGSLEELRELVGDQAPGVLAELHDAGYTRANDDGTWTVPSPGLLALALQLRGAGVDVELSGRIRDILRKRLAKAVEETVEALVDRWKHDFGSEDGRSRLFDTLETLRPVVGEMTVLILAREIEQELGDLVTSRAVDLARADDSD